MCSICSQIRLAKDFVSLLQGRQITGKTNIISSTVTYKPGWMFAIFVVTSRYLPKDQCYHSRQGIVGIASWLSAQYSFIGISKKIDGLMSSQIGGTHSASFVTLFAQDEYIHLLNTLYS